MSELDDAEFLAALRAVFLDDTMLQCDRQERLVRMMQYRWEPAMSELRLQTDCAIAKRNLNADGTVKAAPPSRKHSKAQK